MLTSPPRVLFLRSHSKICALSFIANGLAQSSTLEFEQYPPLPPKYRSKLQKLPHPEMAWQDLNRNCIPTSDELVQKITDGYFDGVLLADHDGLLSQYQNMNWFQISWARARLWKQARHDFQTQYQYWLSLPYSITQLCQNLPVAIVDLSDYPYLPPSVSQDILNSCAAYFKREVPYNRFILYHAWLEFRFLSQAGKNTQLVSLLDKVHGIPLGIPDTKFHELTTLRTQEQDIDLLWVGRMSNSMRAKAVTLLKEYATRTSWKILIPEKRLSYTEFCRTVARSKITLSVEGGGWDCDRHYEAAALGSLPLINTPTVDAVWWHTMPPQIFFKNDFSNFFSRIEQLLRNDALRQDCLQTLDAQIRTHMLWSKIVEYMIETLKK